MTTYLARSISRSHLLNGSVEDVTHWRAFFALQKPDGAEPSDAAWGRVFGVTRCERICSTL